MRKGLYTFALALSIVNALGLGNALVEKDWVRAAYCAISLVGFTVIQMVLTKRESERSK